MEEAHAFYVRYGGAAIVLARFIPILRTFVPFAAGVARMAYRRFVLWNIVGGIGWVTSMLWIGYYLGQTSWADRLDKLIFIVIVVSFLPLVFGFLKRWWTIRARAKSGVATPPPIPLPGDESEP